MVFKVNLVMMTGEWGWAVKTYKEHLLLQDGDPKDRKEGQFCVRRAKGRGLGHAENTGIFALKETSGIASCSFVGWGN
jgi:hypothetical protein